METATTAQKEFSVHQTMQGKDFWPYLSKAERQQQIDAAEIAKTGFSPLRDSKQFQQEFKDLIKTMKSRLNEETLTRP